MDGSVSTLAPVFAAAFATQKSWDAFLVGDWPRRQVPVSEYGVRRRLCQMTGSLTGRGHPWVRESLICRSDDRGGWNRPHRCRFSCATSRWHFGAAGIVVLVELGAITWVRKRYMDTPWISAALQVGLGGVLVFITPACSSGNTGYRE